MCTTCGCGDGNWMVSGARAPAHEHRHRHQHDDGTWHEHAHPGAHAHGPPAGNPAVRTLSVEQDLLAHNDAIAAGTRQRLAARGVFALNLVSSPGSGKTTLVVETVRTLQARGTPVAVIEGDQQTSLDADRVRAVGAEAVQINTEKGCHLDARMVAHALDGLRVADDSVLLIENVGNLVCPAAFDLGEAHKVVVLSVTEGEDKPLKYADMFRAADLLVVNKSDLLEYVDFDLDTALGYARQVQPRIEVIVLSALTGEGFDRWIAWVEAGLACACATRWPPARSA